MRFRRPPNDSLRHPPTVRARSAPGRATTSSTAAGRPPRSRRRLVQEVGGRSATVRADAAPGPWADGGRAFVTAAWIAGAVGALLLTVGSIAAHPTLALGLLLAVTGMLIRRPPAAERVLSGVMVVLLAPLLLGIGLAVRLTSSGPTLVRPAGAPGRTNSALRFRTTFAGGGSSVTADDARCTPIGRLLRRSCLDELPGLLDGLRGELSLFRSGRR